MAIDVESAVAARLAAASVGTLGTDMFISPIQPVSSIFPASCLFVQESDGYMPLSYLGVGNIFRRVLVEVHVRGPKRRTAKLLANEALLALDHQDLSMAGFIWCKAMTARAIDNGPDSDKNYEFYFSVEVAFEETVP